MEHGKLNDWLVSMATGISYSLWKEACSAYAVQLIKDDEIVKGASYYLMSHQVLEAIEILRVHHFYRAAVSIAKSRFPDDVPLIRELYTAWAFQASNDGSYEVAAKCWIAASELSQAAALLAKRPDPSSLRVSSLLALKAGEVEKSRALALQCMTLCLKAKNWECLELLAVEAKLPEISSVWEETKNRLHEKPVLEDSLIVEPANSTMEESIASSPKTSTSPNRDELIEDVKLEDTSTP